MREWKGWGGGSLGGIGGREREKEEGRRGRKLTSHLSKKKKKKNSKKNDSTIPSVVDGFKPGQRKILFCAFKRNLKSDIKVAQLVSFFFHFSLDFFF